MNTFDSDPEYKSKSQRKREMHDLQDLGKELVALNAQQLAKIPLEESLLNAILEAQRITSHGALKRQLQYIGRLMRDYDPVPIQAALATLQSQHQQGIGQLHRIERYRDALVAQGDAALTEVLETFPQADRQHLRQLIRKAQQEQQKNQPPQSARQIFKYLKGLLDV